MYFFFFKQKTAYEMRISDWSSDVCSSDLSVKDLFDMPGEVTTAGSKLLRDAAPATAMAPAIARLAAAGAVLVGKTNMTEFAFRSEEHTSELQSLMRISYAVFCLKKKTKPQQI